MIRLLPYKLIDRGLFTQSQSLSNKMKLLFWTFFNIFAGSPVSVIPEKLKLYQNVTGIDDSMLMEIFQKTIQGKSSNVFQIFLPILRGIRQHLTEISLHWNDRKRNS